MIGALMDAALHCMNGICTLAETQKETPGWFTQMLFHNAQSWEGCLSCFVSKSHIGLLIRNTFRKINKQYVMYTLPKVGSLSPSIPVTVAPVAPR